MIRRPKAGHHNRSSVVMAAGRTPPARKPNTFLKQIYGLLERNLEDPLVNVEWLANQLSINRKTLYRQLKSRIQRSPTELIRQFRLQKAAKLLVAGYTVSETAGLVGFNTPSHFATVFKEFYRQTPTEYMDRLPK